jgi:hypothetical protein
MLRWVNAMWILVLGFAALAAIFMMGRWSHGRGRQADLGSVSEQWVAEHRLSQAQDSQR